MGLWGGIGSGRDRIGVAEGTSDLGASQGALAVRRGTAGARLKIHSYTQPTPDIALYPQHHLEDSDRPSGAPDQAAEAAATTTESLAKSARLGVALKETEKRSGRFVSGGRGALRQAWDGRLKPQQRLRKASQTARGFVGASAVAEGSQVAGRVEDSSGRAPAPEGAGQERRKASQTARGSAG